MALGVQRRLRGGRQHRAIVPGDARQSPSVPPLLDRLQLHADRSRGQGHVGIADQELAAAQFARGGDPRRLRLRAIAQLQVRAEAFARDAAVAVLQPECAKLQRPDDLQGVRIRLHAQAPIQLPAGETRLRPGLRQQPLHPRQRHLLQHHRELVRPGRRARQLHTGAGMRKFGAQGRFVQPDRQPHRRDAGGAQRARAGPAGRR
ncbi:hypothetical protein LJB71_06315 [Thermomonas sp. S9]|uniref:hypothetical protein n=1 Tax=Thermomonas sp. S9 TaxID=2885203 RepID=UPI00216B39D3|nr:hypothetical protein [Thermomonas sp. S9]MCR6495872.1 hypothetical protein [Thermomonas sp. S9]